MEYELAVTQEEVLEREDLNGTEVRVAMAIGKEVPIDEIPGADLTKTRCLRALVKKSIIKPRQKKAGDPIEKPEETPVNKWLSSDIKPFSRDESGSEYESFSTSEIYDMGRDGRFVTFCRLMDCDGNNQDIRRAWVHLEDKYALSQGDAFERDGSAIKLPYMVSLSPQIFKSAQHYTRWVENSLIPPVDIDEWLTDEHFNRREYMVRPGHGPLPADDEDAWMDRVRDATNALDRLGVEYVAMNGHERPKQAAKRLEAKLRGESRRSAMQ